MNRLLFFLLLVLSVACVGAVAGVEPAARAAGETGPEELTASGEGLAGVEDVRTRVESTQDLGSVPGSSDSRDGVPAGELELKGPEVDLKGPKVKLEQTQRGKEERPAEDNQEVRNPSERGNQTVQSQNHQAQTSDSEPTSSSSGSPSPAGSPTTSRTDETTTVGDTS
ncbi:uncharacterized protein TM35_000641000, partial [Trypanosoma theileri]